MVDLGDVRVQRAANFRVEHGHWLLDLSRQRITAQTLALLFDLARAADLPARIAAMFRGDAINSTEGRAVLHTALRSSFAGPPTSRPRCANRAALTEFAAAVRRGDCSAAPGGGSRRW